MNLVTRRLGGVQVFADVFRATFRTFLILTFALVAAISIVGLIRACPP